MPLATAKKLMRIATSKGMILFVALASACLSLMAISLVRCWDTRRPATRQPLACRLPLWFCVHYILLGTIKICYLFNCTYALTEQGGYGPLVLPFATDIESVNFHRNSFIVRYYPDDDAHGHWPE